MSVQVMNLEGILWSVFGREIKGKHSADDAGELGVGLKLRGQWPMWAIPTELTLGKMNQQEDF